MTSATWISADASGTPELAGVLVPDNGESIKKLHTLILTSSVYRQVCQENADGTRLDADNRLLGRMNRQRLDAKRSTMRCCKSAAELT